ncbi:MAG: hypothetical protein M5R40_11330 [Anaerolineae bacterium]|nr:hypothetical protein [Anaerolineae bacterium]
MQSDAISRERAQRAQRRIATGCIAVLAALVLIAFGVVLVLFPLFEGTLQTLVNVGAFLFGVILLLLGIFLATSGLATNAADPRGARLAQVLSTVLDANHVLVREPVHGGLDAKIDALVIGSGGIVLFKLVDDAGIFRCEGDLWLKRAPGKDFQVWHKNPTRDFLPEIDRVRAHLVKRSLTNVPLTAVIVLTDPYAEISARAPAIPVTTLFNLPVELRNGYLLNPRIDDEMQRRVRRAFAGRR